MSPRIPKSEKARFLGAALKDTPRDFVLWLQALVKRGRQGILREVASEYLALVDEKMNRVRASVTLARQPDEKLRQNDRGKSRSPARQAGNRDVSGGAGDPRRCDHQGGRPGSGRIGSQADDEAAAAAAEIALPSTSETRPPDGWPLCYRANTRSTDGAGERVPLTGFSPGYSVDRTRCHGSPAATGTRPRRLARDGAVPGSGCIRGVPRHPVRSL